MSAPFQASEIMARRLITLRPNMDIFEAIGILLKHRISGAPVVDEYGNYVGVFSESNCLSMLVNAAYDQLPTTELFAFVTTDAPTITEETDVLTMAQLFLHSNTRRLPVLRDRELVGQVSRRDVVRAVHDRVMKSDTHGSQLLYLSSVLGRDEAPVDA